MLQVKFITRQQLSRNTGLGGPTEYAFQKPLNNALEEIEASGGSVQNIKYNIAHNSGYIESIVIEYRTE